MHHLVNLTLLCKWYLRTQLVNGKGVNESDFDPALNQTNLPSRKANEKGPQQEMGMREKESF